MKTQETNHSKKKDKSNKTKKSKKTERLMQQTDYRTYRLHGRELAAEFLLSLLPGLLINLLFYRSVMALWLIVPFAFGFFRMRVADKKKRRAEKIHRDFRQALAAFSTSLDAGRSVENAIPEIARHLSSVCGEEADMTRELMRMERQLGQMRRPAELFASLASRTDDPDIRRFAAVFAIAESHGGNLSDIVRDAAREIGEKIAVEEEIDALLAAKKYEQKIMAIVPAALIVYMSIASPGFLDVLYEGIFGRLVMSAALLIYLFAFFWGKRIAEVKL